MARTTSHAPASRPPLRGTSIVNVGDTERWISAVGGGLLTALGLYRRSLGGLLMAAAGGVLLYRGTTGHCPLYHELGANTAGTQPRAVHVHESLTVDKPRSEVYAFWRRLENLPRFMHHLESVQEIDATRSQWVARIPKDLGHLQWEAEILEEDEGRLLRWRSLPGADVHNAGLVRFEDAPGDRGTVVSVTIDYRPPAGDQGAASARLFNVVNEQIIKEDLRRFRSTMEAGVVPTTEGQPSGQSS